MHRARGPRRRHPGGVGRGRGVRRRGHGGTLHQDPGRAARLLERSPPVLEDGWFRTGDLARISPGGFVEITGRLRERILRGGYSVFPQEVEAVLAEHPDVAEAAVVGVPHAELGEEVAAFVVAKPGTSPGTDSLAAYCADRLARFKYPRQIRVVPELPKGPTGKVVKAELLRGLSAEKGEGEKP